MSAGDQPEPSPPSAPLRRPRRTLERKLALCTAALAIIPVFACTLWLNVITRRAWTENQARNVALVAQTQEMVRLTSRHPLPVSALQDLQRHEQSVRRQAVALSLQSPSTASLAVSLVRDSHNDDGTDISTIVRSRLATYQRWQSRLGDVLRQFRVFHGQRRKARTIPMAQSA